MSNPSEVAIGKLLVARRSMRGTKWDGAHLDHFVQVLCRLDCSRHGFGVDDLDTIEKAWIGQADDTWCGGVVARLKDGRRAHVDGRAGRSHWAEDSAIETGLLDADAAHLESAARHGWQDHAWSEGLAYTLNAFLGRYAAQRVRPATENSR